MRSEKQDTARRFLLRSIAIGILFAGCQDASEPLLESTAPVDLDAYQLQIEAGREARERAFRDPAHSPVPQEELADWTGLEFYPVDPSYRLEGELVRHAQPRSLTIPDTGAQERPAQEVGYFVLDLGAGPERLPVFRMMDGGHWFLPFLDATSEVETYPAGRYLELVELAKDRFRLDFNEAYNPYCAYGGDWSCPITPESNRLKAEVRAGERGYRFLHE